jgi:hypothetical protein
MLKTRKTKNTKLAYRLLWICFGVQATVSVFTIWMNWHLSDDSLPTSLPFSLRKFPAWISYLGIGLSSLILGMITGLHRWRNKSKNATPSQNGSGEDLFGGVELFALLLPGRTHRQIFEPSFNDSKERFIATRRKCNTEWKLRWWTFCLWKEAIFLSIQSVWVSLGDRLKGMVLRCLPDVFRNFSGRQ